MNGTIKSIQLFLGILTGLLGLSAIAGGVGYYLFITQISTHPPKPVFAEEREGSKTAVSTKSPSPLPNAIQKLAPEAYNAKVTGQNGLSLQKEADPNAEKLSSLALNDKVAIVKTSDDGKWVLVQPEKDNIQGWIEAANVQKTAGTSTAKDKEPAAPAAKEASAPQTPPRTRRAAASDEEQLQPRRRRRRVKVEPQPQADDNSNDQQPQPKRRRKAVVEANPQADDNNDEQPQPKRRRKPPIAAPEPSADEQESDN